MKSSIKVDFTGAGNESNPNTFKPVIRVIIEDSDDPRDGLLSSLFQSLGGDSSWLHADFDYHTMNGISDSKKYITLTPVYPNDLYKTKIAIEERLQGRLKSTGTQLKSDKELIENKWQVCDIKREGNFDIEGKPMAYSFKTTKSLKGLREGILKEAIEAVINNPDNFVE